MIKNVPLRSLRNAEHHQFLTELVRSLRPKPLQCDAQVSALAGLVSQMDHLYANDPAAALTDELAALDDIRDDLIIGLVKLIEANEYNPEPDKRRAAEVLALSLETYGTAIASQSYSTESATISCIVRDWKRDARLGAALTLLDATIWATELERANDNFIGKYSQQSGGQTSATTHDAVKAMRNEANRAYSELKERIDSFYTINNLSGPWSEAIEKMNALIDRCNATLKSRHA